MSQGSGLSIPVRVPVLFYIQPAYMHIHVLVAMDTAGSVTLYVSLPQTGPVWHYWENWKPQWTGGVTDLSMAFQAVLNRAGFPGQNE